MSCVNEILETVTLTEGVVGWMKFRSKEIKMGKEKGKERKRFSSSKGRSNLRRARLAAAFTIFGMYLIEDIDGRHSRQLSVQ